MKKWGFRLRGRGWVAARLLLLIFASVVAARAELVTIDFTLSGPFGSRQALPWHEDGFTVVGLTTNLFGAPWTPDNPIVANERGTTNDWALHFGGGAYVGRAMITNDARLPFDLLSLDVLLSSSGRLILARIISSAGGVYDLPTTPGQGTLQFNGASWKNLSYVLIEFQGSAAYDSPVITLPSLFVDNIVLRSVQVPEPAGLGVGVWLGLGWMCRNRRRGKMETIKASH